MQFFSFFQRFIDYFQKPTVQHTIVNVDNFELGAIKENKLKDVIICTH